MLATVGTVAMFVHVPPAAREVSAILSGFVAIPRVLPIGLGSRRSTLLIERNIYVYRRGWMVIFSGFFEPLFYLVAIGIGIGGMIGDGARAQRHDDLVRAVRGAGAARHARR